jgi:transcriptional regulator with XRE-family HTH domain
MQQEGNGQTASQRQPGLAAWRRRAGLTQRELAKAAGVAASTIEELEQSMRPNVRASTQRKICRAVGAARPELIEEFRMAILMPPRRRGPPPSQSQKLAQQGGPGLQAGRA